MKKRLLSILLTIVMVIGIIPAVPVHAATSYGIYIAGTEVTSEYYFGTAGDGKWEFDEESKTLTLDNATISSSSTCGLSITQDGVTVVFKGENTVTGADAAQDGVECSAGIHLITETVFKGEDGAVLYATGGDGTAGFDGGAGINGLFKLESGTVIATGGVGATPANDAGSGKNGMPGVGGTVTVSGGTLIAYGGNGGNGGTKSYRGGQNGGDGGYGVSSTVTVSGGTVIAIGGAGGTGKSGDGSVGKGIINTVTLGAGGKVISSTAVTTVGLAEGLADDGYTLVSETIESGNTTYPNYTGYSLYETKAPLINYGIYIAGVEITSDNLSDDDEGWEFEPSTNTLTLTNATIEAEAGVHGIEIGASVAEDVTIELVGESTVTGGDSDSNDNVGYGITYGGDATLIIKGEGTLNVQGGSHDYYGFGFAGISCIGTLNIKNGTINATGGKGASGISMPTASSSLTVEGGKVTATAGEGDYAYGISGKTEITGGTLTATGSTAAFKSAPTITTSDTWKGVAKDKNGNPVTDCTAVTYVIIEHTELPEITGVSITVDGVTYTSGNVTITPTSTISYTVSGKNFANMNEVLLLSFTGNTNVEIKYLFTIDAEKNTAVWDATSFLEYFEECDGDDEVRYINDQNGDWIGTGIYLTYDDGTVDTSTHSDHCICGGTATVLGHTHLATNPTWTAWTATDSLPTEAGYYYLTGDVTLTEAWSPADETFLCLNGYDIIVTKAGDVISVGSGVNFTLTDCEPIVGKITHGSDIIGRGVYVAGTFNMYGGSIADNTLSASSGIGVCVETGAFNMYGGSITGNSTSTGSGGGVDIDENCVFNMYGGSISGNSTNRSGGGVSSSGTFTMLGGSISGNSAGQYGGGVSTLGMTIGGSAQITGNTLGTGDSAPASNLYLDDSRTFTISTDNPLTTTVPIGVSLSVKSAQESYDITGTNGSDYSDKFVSEAEGYEIGLGANNVLQLVKVKSHSHVWSYSASGATITATCTADGCTDGGSVTVIAPENLIYGTTATTTASVSGAFTTGAATPTPAYQYKADENGTYADFTDVPTNAGFYKATISMANTSGSPAMAYVEYQIAKSNEYTAPGPIDAVYGQTLADIEAYLPELWTWVNPENPVGSVGEQTHRANYAGDVNHNAQSNIGVTVIVSAATADDDMKTAAGNLIQGSVNTVTLPALPDGASYGTPTFNVTYVKSATVVDGALKVTGTMEVVEGGEYTVEIPVSGGNYNDYTVTVTLTGVESKLVSLSFNPDTYELTSPTVVSGGAYLTDVKLIALNQFDKEFALDLDTLTWSCTTEDGGNDSIDWNKDQDAIFVAENSQVGTYVLTASSGTVSAQITIVVKPRIIDSVSADVTAPVKYAEFTSDVPVVTDDYYYTINWTNKNGGRLGNGTFEAGTVYRALVNFYNYGHSDFSDDIKNADYTDYDSLAEFITLNITGNVEYKIIEAYISFNGPVVYIEFEATEDKVLEKLEVTTPPTKLVYVEGDSFDIDGMVITATYDDDSTADVAADVIFPDTALTGGQTTITGTYGGKEVVIEITVLYKVEVGDFTYKAPDDLVYSRSKKEATVTGDDAYGDITIEYYSDEALTIKVDPIDAGTYYVGITTAGGDNYAAVTVPMYVGSFTITPKTVEVKADSKTMKYGDEVPTLTHNGVLIDGDSFSGTLKTTATSTTGVGSYPITQGSLTAGDNYTISFTGNSVTINKADAPAAPTVTGSYEDDGMTYTYTVNAIDGAEYSKDGTTWQDSNVFSGLAAGQTYTFYARIKETTNVKAGEIGTSAEVDLSKLPGNGSVEITGWTYGEYDEDVNAPETDSTTGNPVASYLYESTDGKGYSNEATPTDAGDYRLTVTFAATDTHNGTTASATFTIAKADPDVKTPTGLRATYGDTLARIDLAPGWAWADDVTTPVGTVAGPNTFKVIYTHPTEPDNYNTVEKTVTIDVSPKVVTATVTVVGENFIFNGGEQTPGVIVKDGENTIPQGEYTVTYTNNTNAGTATVTITDKDGGNYTVTGETTFVIAKKTSAALSGVEREFLRTIATTGNEIDVEAMLPDDHGEVTYTVTSSGYTVLENVDVDADGKLVFDTKISETAASDTITVKVEMQNYTDVTLTVSVILGEKTPLEITGVSAATGLIYNGSAQQGYTGTPASDFTGTYEITYTGRSNAYNSSTAPTNAGDYTVTFKIPDSDLYYSGNVSVNFTIAKAQATVTADDKKIHIGNRMPELTYQVSGLLGNDTIRVALSCDADIYRCGEYPIVASATDPNGNYQITTVDGTLSVKYYPHNPIVTPTYPPVVQEEEGGDVVVTPARPEKGDTVIITPDPDAGYEVDKVTVTDKNGDPVAVNDNGDGTYSYKQPSGKVTVNVTYKETVVVDGPCDGTYADNCPSLIFTDVDQTLWYHEAVDYVIENSLMNGVGGNLFDINGTTTRAQIVTILWRLEGTPVVNYAMSFEDVAADTWYTEAVRWAQASKIVTGYSAEAFGPNDAITREQFATILYRYEQYKGGGFKGLWMYRMDYTDLAEISDWAYEAMAWCNMKGIIGGKGNNILDPKGNATRAEAATILYRYCDVMTKGEEN